MSLAAIQSPEYKKRQGELTKERFASGDQISPTYIRKSRFDGKPYHGLSDTDICIIRADRRVYSDIASQYEISIATVSLIKNYQLYSRVEQSETFIGPPGASGYANKRPRLLSDNDIRAIRIDGRFNVEVAKDYNISNSLVGQIKRYRVYAHVIGEKVVVAARRSGKHHPRSRAVITPEGIFPTLTKAARHYGISNSTATIWARRGTNGWNLK